MIRALYQLKQRLPSMSPTEKKIAACVLENPSLVVNETLTHLARRAGVSSGSVANFAAAMGFKGFTDMKIHIAQSLDASPAVTFDDVTAADSPRQAMLKLIQSAQDSFESTYGAMTEELSQAADLLMNAKYIGIYASGSSLPVGYDAHYRLMRLGLPVQLQPDPLLACIAASHMPEGSVALAISHKGRTTTTLAAVETAKARGAKVITLTSFPQSPLTALSDVNLISVSGEALAYREAVVSRLSQLLIVDSLCAYIAAQRGMDAMAYLDNEMEVLEQYRQKEET